MSPLNVSSSTTADPLPTVYVRRLPAEWSMEASDGMELENRPELVARVREAFGTSGVTTVIGPLWVARV
jgi:hypothetical protein